LVIAGSATGAGDGDGDGVGCVRAALVIVSAAKKSVTIAATRGEILILS
jgi:hypothetical protein